MARDRKGSVVERITHPKTKRVGVLRMEKGSFTFFCRIPDEDENSENRHTREYFESKDAQAVKAWINERIKKSETQHRLEWKPVIRVDFERPDRGWQRRRGDESREVAVKAEMTRFYVALSHDRTDWLKLEWNDVSPDSATALDEDDRLSRADRFRDGPKKVMSNSYNTRDHTFTLPLIEDDVSYVAYTPELWAGLNAIMDTLDRSATTLVEMLGTKKGLAVVAEVGAGMKQLGSGNIAPASE